MSTPSDVNCVFLRGTVKAVGKGKDTYDVWFVRTETEADGRYQVHTVIDKRSGRPSFDVGEPFPLTFGRARYFQDRCTILVDDETDREGLDLIASIMPPMPPASNVVPISQQGPRALRPDASAAFRRPRSYTTREPITA